MQRHRLSSSSDSTSSDDSGTPVDILDDSQGEYFVNCNADDDPLFQVGFACLFAWRYKGKSIAVIIMKSVTMIFNLQLICCTLLMFTFALLLPSVAWTWLPP